MKPEKLRPSNALKARQSNTAKPCTILGYATLTEGAVTREHPILSAGPVQVGTETYILGVIPKQTGFYLARDAQVYRWKKDYGRPPVPDPTQLDTAGKELWADEQARQFFLRAVPAAERRAIEPMVSRYQELVRALVEGAIIDLAAANVIANGDTLARGVHRDWTAKELLAPRQITLRHAVYTALVLGLHADQATTLIEYAAAIEYRIPIISRSAAASIYQQAVRQLATLCQAWWNKGAATQWNRLGTNIDELFRLQFVRLVNDANTRDLPLEELLGLRLDRTAYGNTPSEYVKENLHGESVAASSTASGRSR